MQRNLLYLLIVCPIGSLIFWNNVSVSQPPYTPPPPPEIAPENFYVEAIAWNTKYWLVGGSYPIKENSVVIWMPLLWRFDGVNFIDLAPQLDLKDKRIDRISSNYEYWLIGYSFHEYGGLRKYDGERFYEIPLPGMPPLSIRTMEWNGDYWLAGSCYMGFGYLIRYDGESLVELKQDLSCVSSINWMKNHWLINGEDSLGARKTLKYDGSVFTDIDFPDLMEASGVGGGILLFGLHEKPGSLLKYDGVAFNDLTSEADFEGEQISAITWNGNYWLIGSQTGILKKYDGVTFADLTDEGSLKSIEAIAWNGEYWLIGGDGVLKKYDGITFTDLTENFNSALTRQEGVTPEPQKSGFSAFIFSISSIAIFIFLWNNNRK